MSSDEPTPYEVGYKKPPREHQFRKGEPSARKGKARVDRVIDIGALLNEPVEAKLRGQPIKRDEYEVRLQSLAEKAIRGDVAAARDVLKYAERGGLILPASGDEGSCGLVFWIPREWDWDEWHENYRVFGSPPWLTDPDGLVPPERRNGSHG